MIIHFLVFPYHCYNKSQAKSNRPTRCKHEISDYLHYSILFILFCYTKLYTDPHVNKDFFLFKFCSKDSLSCSKVGATHVRTKPQHFKKIFKSKVDGQLSSANVKFLLIQGREAKFLLHLFCEPRSWYIANQSGSAKETVT